MKRLLSLLLWTPLLAAGPIPGRYIVELEHPPLSEAIRRSGLPHLARRSAITTAGLNLQRDEIHIQQTNVKRSLEKTTAKVIGSLDTLVNALVVTVPDADAGKLSAIPGVRRVYQAREVHRHLDHAVALHRGTDLWSQIGFDKAGLGVKVGILDSGIDSNHPGFQDSTLPALDGFPKVTNDTDIAFTNNKIIVARSYVDRLRLDPDPSAADHVGHGTFVAMIVAGNTNQAPLAPITGMAPRAYLGNYKVFGSPGLNDSTTDDVILAALEDALRDGMDIVNLSLGAPVPPSLSDDLEV
jgi:minor extracellular serine protease Vpr